MANRTKARDAGAIVIAHGSDAIDHAKEYLQNGADFVLVGEAEQSLVELCASILAGGALSKEIAGVIRLDAEGKLVQSSVKSPRNANWKNLVKPARELVDLEPYRDAWIKAHGYFSTNVVASRGCPYRCNWCAKPISGNKFQLRPPQLVADEIRELKEVYGVEHIWSEMTSSPSTCTGSNNSRMRLKHGAAHCPSRFNPAPIL